MEPNPSLATTPGHRPEPYAQIRWQAGWTHEAGTWLAPDGTPAADWALEGHPFPEDAGYADWANAFWHYEHLNTTDP